MSVSVDVADFPVSHRQQWQNVMLYALTNGLLYLSAPVLYVGITHASLCNRLGSSNTTANLPVAAFYWATVASIIVTWRFHTLAAIKPVIVMCNLIAAAAGLIVAAALYWPVPITAQLVLIVVYGGLIGGSFAVLNAFSWEFVSRGIAPERRGVAFSLSYGLGPLLAVVGSLFAQLIISGSVELPWWSPSGGLTMRGLEIAPIEFPGNFAALFFASAPILVLAALLSAWFVLPTDFELPARVPFVSSLARSGRDLFADAVLLCAVVANLLVRFGSTITANLSLYTSNALGRSAESYAGYQNAILFSFKVVAGLFLGWLLARTHAKMGMVVAGSFCLIGILWAVLLPKQWFLICFGFMGAGELFAIYGPNYVMNRSHPGRVRHNMAMMQVLGLATGVGPLTFGIIADTMGLPSSFVVAAAVVAVSLLLMAIALPARPEPLPEGEPS